MVQSPCGELLAQGMLLWMGWCGVYHGAASGSVHACVGGVCQGQKRGAGSCLLAFLLVDLLLEVRKDSFKSLLIFTVKSNEKNKVNVLS